MAENGRFFSVARVTGEGVWPCRVVRRDRGRLLARSLRTKGFIGFDWRISIFWPRVYFCPEGRFSGTAGENRP